MKNIEIIESIDSQGRPTILVNGVDVCDDVPTANNIHDYRAAVMLAYNGGTFFTTPMTNVECMAHSITRWDLVVPTWRWDNSIYRITRPKVWEPEFPDGKGQWEEVKDGYIHDGDFLVNRKDKIAHTTPGPYSLISDWNASYNGTVYRRKKTWEPVFPDGADKWERVTDWAYIIKIGDLAISRSAQKLNHILVSGCDAGTWIKCGYQVYHRKAVKRYPTRQEWMKIIAKHNIWKRRKNSPADFSFYPINSSEAITKIMGVGPSLRGGSLYQWSTDLVNWYPCEIIDGKLGGVLEIQ